MEVDDFNQLLWKPHSYIFSNWRAYPIALDVKLTKDVYTGRGLQPSKCLNLLEFHNENVAQWTTCPSCWLFIRKTYIIVRALNREIVTCRPIAPNFPDMFLGWYITDLEGVPKNSSGGLPPTTPTNSVGLIFFRNTYRPNNCMKISTKLD